MGKRYEVWVTLEEWNGDDKITDIETSKVCTVQDEDDGRTMFGMVEAHAIAGRDFMAQVKWAE